MKFLLFIEKFSVCKCCVNRKCLKWYCNSKSLNAGVLHGGNIYMEKESVS